MKKSLLQKVENAIKDCPDYEAIETNVDVKVRCKDYRHIIGSHVIKQLIKIKRTATYAHEYTNTIKNEEGYIKDIETGIEMVVYEL